MSAQVLSAHASALSSLAERLRKSTVQVRSSRSGGGSGVIWRGDGVIVTNAHVVPGKRMAVELFDGTTLRAALTDYDAERDIASLKVDAADLPAAPIGNSDTLRAGELAFAVGNPMGLVGAVTSGIIFAGGSQDGRRARWIQADVRIAPGSSGGPLADARGRVIGINSMIYSGLAIAVPSNAVVRFLRGKVQRPQLGVVVEPVSLRTDASPVLGLLIFEVADDSVAERAGLLSGDTIIQINGRSLSAADDLPEALADAAPDGGLALTLVRAGSALTLTVPLSHERAPRIAAA